VLPRRWKMKYKCVECGKETKHPNKFVYDYYIFCSLECQKQAIIRGFIRKPILNEKSIDKSDNEQSGANSR
jgi:DNA-directed RNA polymerase subunit RPC12/RpoP